MTDRKCASNSARKLALTMLISSMINHRHCCIRWAASTFFAPSDPGSLEFSDPHAKGVIPKAACNACPSSADAFVAYRAAT